MWEGANALCAITRTARSAGRTVNTSAASAGTQRRKTQSTQRQHGTERRPAVSKERSDSTQPHQRGKIISSQQGTGKNKKRGQSTGGGALHPGQNIKKRLQSTGGGEWKGGGTPKSTAGETALSLVRLKNSSENRFDFIIWIAVAMRK